MKPSTRILSVGELTRYIRMKMDGDAVLQNIWLRGEISNFTLHRSGHLYFTIKDGQSRIKAVMFQSHALRLKFMPREGTKVLAGGRVSVYERDGQYQFYVQDMQPDGIGSLYLAFEELKRKLEDEGLFDESRKRPLPRYPRTIGVVTSPTGAAVRDIIITLRRRYPLVEVLLAPVLVQGNQAAASIAKAVETLSAREEVDLLIVGRGGGSIEELWPFNEEAVARSIAAASVPVISAVGHETDFTIADFAADMRAATPTAAAELAVPNRMELKNQLAYLNASLFKQMTSLAARHRERLRQLRRSAGLARPERLTEPYTQHLDRQRERLKYALARQVNRNRGRNAELARKLAARHPGERLKYAGLRCRKNDEMMRKAMRQYMSHARRTWLHHMERLDGLSPLKVMKRGYGMVYDESGVQIIRSIREVRPAERIRVQISDGTLNCEVKAVTGEGDTHDNRA